MNTDYMRRAYDLVTNVRSAAPAEVFGHIEIIAIGLEAIEQDTNARCVQAYNEGYEHGFADQGAKADEGFYSAFQEGCCGPELDHDEYEQDDETLLGNVDDVFFSDDVKPSHRATPFSSMNNYGMTERELRHYLDEQEQLDRAACTLD